MCTQTPMFFLKKNNYPYHSQRGLNAFLASIILVRLAGVIIRI